jgi:putative ABC transport system permease protein
MVVARLKPGATLPGIQVFLDTTVRRLMSDHSANSAYGGLWRMNPKGLEILARPLSAAFQGDGNWTQLRQTLFGLLAAISFVLLIVCANVANLTLAQVERRQHELAIRVATGASQGRLMRQLLTENLILALLGGGAGLVVTAWGLKALMALNVMPRLRPVEIDGPLLGVAFALSTLTGLAFGLAPIWRGGRVRVNMLLADGGMNATDGRQRSHYRSALVIAQLAITVVLLTGAGLMLRSVSRLLQVNPGFDPQNLLLVNMTLPWRKYDEPKDGAELKNLLFAQLHERFSALPGVKAVGFHQSDTIFGFQVEGRKGPLYALHAQVSVGTSDFFKVMRAPLLAGRYLVPEDGAQKRLVVINETMARQFWPGETALGKKFHLADSDSADDSFEVIGVVGDARIYGYTEDIGPTVYHPFQSMWTRLHLTVIGGGVPPQAVIRADGDLEVITPFVRRELKSAEPALFMPNFRAAKQVLFDSTLAQRTYRNYLGVFAGLGLLLSALGIYGVLAYSVARRTREIGIRLAIGAEARQIHVMIMRQGAWLIGAGLITGLGASMGLTRFLQSQLYHVSPNDPLVMSAVVGLLSVIALVACWLPARRAAKVDPVVALRAE